MKKIGIDWVHDFVNGEGKLVRPTREGLVDLGRAYGLFFYEQYRELTEVVVGYNTKLSQPELSLTKGKKCMEKYPAFNYYFGNKLGHVLEARQPKVSNKEVADKLAELNASLFLERINAIVYLENRQYVFRN